LFLGNGSLNTFPRQHYVYSNRGTVGNGVFCWSLPRSLRKTTEESVKRELELEAEESPLLKVVARK
jgi:hypothetical protein